jgi:uncharacterized protein (TIGR03083 family)
MSAGEPVVSVLDEEWAAIAALGHELEDAEWARPTECPGWTVRDVVSHMVGTERSLLGDPPPPPIDPAPPHVRNDVGAHNEAWVASRRSWSGGAVLAEFEDVTARRLAQMRAFAAERFDEPGPSPVGVVPYREFMNVRVMDCWVHEQDMRVATSRPGHEAGPAAQLAFDRLASGLPFVVGKQAAAPDGSAVRFEVRGDVGRRIDIAVRDGRAAVAGHLDAPTATLEMPVNAFWRLTCGRLSGRQAREAGLVTAGGDDTLGARVLDAMAFMI